MGIKKKKIEIMADLSISRAWKTVFLKSFKFDTVFA